MSVPMIAKDTLDKCLTYLDGASLARSAGVNLLFRGSANQMSFWKTLIEREITEYPKLSLEIRDEKVKTYKDLYRIAYSIIFAMNKELQSKEINQNKLDELFFKIFRYGFEKLISKFSAKAKIDLSRPILETKQTFLHIASEYGHVHIVKFLLGINHPISLPIQPLDVTRGIIGVSLIGGVKGDVLNESPLHKAARWGHLECVKLLLCAKANVNLVNNYTSETALHLAATSDHAQCVYYLIKKGARLDCNDIYGKIPLDVAKSNCIGIIRREMGLNEKPGRSDLCILL